jgi:hypothetical protein
MTIDVRLCNPDSLTHARFNRRTYMHASGRNDVPTPCIIAGVRHVA